MLWLLRLRLRIRSLLSRQTLDEELNGELAFHIAQMKAENIAAGMDAAEAETAAYRAFGSVSSLEEQCRDQRRTRWLEDAFQDALFAVRTFASSPGFTFVAILTLALGIGATSAFFSTTYGILFRPLPYREPHRLIEVVEGPTGVGPVTALRDLSRAV
jgi:putative ABC transport system permease protein